MKKSLLFVAIASITIFTGCQNHDQDHDHGDQHCVQVHKYTPYHDTTSTDTANYYISLDSGNKMVRSYLNSINYQQNDTDLYELLYSADSLRSYLSDPKIVNIKFMFAHTLNYINSGGQNKYAGYQSGALTLVMACYDAQGNYVYHYYPQSPQQAMVLDHCNPCPNCCPTQGSAASDFLIPSNRVNGNK